MVIKVARCYACGMRPTFQRARQPEQKEHRRAHLLATTRSLLEGGVELQALSLNELARRAGMAKANVYRYFESREALLVAVLQEVWGEWYESFRAEHPRVGKRKVQLRTLVSRLARSLGRQPLLCALTAALPSVLEHNLSEDAIRDLKTQSLRLFGEIAHDLADRCDVLSPAAWGELLRDSAHVIMGLYAATHPAPAVARVLADPELRFFARDFISELERFMLALAEDHARRGPGPGPARG